MEELLKDISKSKNFHGTDIEIKDFMNAIPFDELKCIDEYVKTHTSAFFEKDKGDILGYYACKGQEVFKFYIISVNKVLYMALEALPPCFWYEIKSHDDFREVRKSYNGKGTLFQKRSTKISTKLSDNAILGDIMKTVRSDYEYIMLIYNMCMENPFTGNNVFGTDELYDDYISMNKYNSLERALLTKFIIDKEHGFCIRTVHTNSIISVKCFNNIVFFSFYYNECPKNMNNDLPIDLYLFMLNFDLVDIKDILESNNSNTVLTLHSSLPLDYYGEMRYSIYNYLTSNALSDTSSEDSKEYFKLLRSLFTDYTVHKITNEIEDELLNMTNKTNETIISLIKTKFTNEEVKYILDQRLDNMSFVSDNKNNNTVLDAISEEVTISDADDILKENNYNDEPDDESVNKQIQIKLDTNTKAKKSKKTQNKKTKKK